MLITTSTITTGGGRPACNIVMVGEYAKKFIHSITHLKALSNAALFVCLSLYLSIYLSFTTL
jgi:hypothetical protein